jgi:hypothetical protein
LAWYVDYDYTLLQSKGLGIIHAAGVAMGLLSNDGPMPWHPAPDNLKKVCAAAGQYCKVRIRPLLVGTFISSRRMAEIKLKS